MITEYITIVSLLKHAGSLQCVLLVCVNKVCPFLEIHNCPQLLEQELCPKR